MGNPTVAEFCAGQRWVSETEPELGLGTVVEVPDRQVRLLFPAVGEMRLYAAAGAPLRRVEFEVGSEVEDHEGQRLRIEEVRDDEGVLTYVGGGLEIPEALLSDRLQFGGAMDRLLAGDFDLLQEYDLRRRVFDFNHNWSQSEVRGFIGGRIDLIPHQLHVAHEVSARLVPRVMLSDEAGLGKTVEAGLILHRLRRAGRAERVIILVPESLLHQWFVEMLRKFNLFFHIYDSERCNATTTVSEGGNPFLDEQLVLCSLDFLVHDSEMAEHAAKAGWDLAVVDEAHHLTIEGENGDAYAVVEALSANSNGLLLLTATPEQLGLDSHFARLRLLDPDRYRDIKDLEDQSQDFVRMAEVAAALNDNDKLSPAQRDLLAELPGIDLDSMSRSELLAGILDRHGPGRVIFRNTRASVKGFPKRKAHLIPLETPSGNDELARDPRVIWLVEWLENNSDDKALVICRTQELTMGLEAALRKHTSVRCGVFHEGLTLIQRDRNAAWFAEEDGARLLICSEIGSEGRNFQFVQNLVLFDLPDDAELLEQRIGRLDRIGQKGTIQIHIPYLLGGEGEILARWYHEGLGAFERNPPAGGEMMRIFTDELAQLSSADSLEDLTDFLQRVRRKHEELDHQMETGRDRLLELASHNPENSARIAETIRQADLDSGAEQLLFDVLDIHDVSVDELGRRTYSIDNRRFSGESFPGLPRDFLVGTFDRNLALAREDLHLLSPDHPVFDGALELLVTSGTGNCSFGFWETDEDPSLLLETLFVLEPMAASHLDVGRFLPPTPLRILVDPTGAMLEEEVPALKSGSPQTLIEKPRVRKNLLPKMLASAEKHAETQARGIQATAAANMRRKIQSEIDRLLALKKVNPDVRDEEIQISCQQLEELSEAISHARVRLDAVRLIWKGGSIDPISNC